MTNQSIYKNIAQRTGGNIYIGVVGPVRTGKSTFIKRFSESVLLPEIRDPYLKERTRDELPQSASGKTIMTAEPKFIPEEAVKISVGGPTEINVRMIDSVGYLVDGAMGDTEDGAERMVATPWFDHEIPLRQAAEMGTEKVIREHSTIGIVITTDGSFTGIPRESYVEPERRVIRELSALKKPFVVLVNTTDPMGNAAQAITRELRESFGVSVIPVDVLNMDDAKAEEILLAVLMEFPAVVTSIELPQWICSLGSGHGLTKQLMKLIKENGNDLLTMHDAETFVQAMNEAELTERVFIQRIDPGSGEIAVSIDMPRSLFYDTLSEDTGLEIRSDGDLMVMLKEFAEGRNDYAAAVSAVREAREHGYAVILPEPEEVTLCEPEVVKRSGRYGLRLRANAPAIHLIRTTVETEVSPAVRGEGSSEELLQRLLEEFEGDTARIWNTNMFGKAMSQIAEEGITAKIRKLPPEICDKMGGTLQRAVNEGGSGMVCILF